MKDLSLARSEAPAEWMGNTFRTMLGAAESGGALSLVDNAVPAGFGPPRHVHAREDEGFAILSGEVEFWVAGERFLRGPGEGAFVPRGTEHAFRALTDVRMIVILAPGGFEGFFADMARGAFRIPEDMPAVLESAARHGMTLTGPPLGAE